MERRRLGRITEAVLAGEPERVGLERPYWNLRQIQLIADWVRQKAGRPTLIPPPLHIAEKLAAKVVDRRPEGSSGDEVCDGEWIYYLWTPDRRGCGERIYHGVGHRAFVVAKWPHTEADVHLLACELALPAQVVPLIRNRRHALKVSPWAPGWMLDAQMRLVTENLGVISGAYKFRDGILRRSA